MSSTIERPRFPMFHPFHAVLLGGTITLFLGALLCDIAYARTFEIQWNNFASWLIVGGLVVGAVALACSTLGLLPSRRTRQSILHAALLLATLIAGLLNALMHARDAWASMPGGLVLSVLVFVLACVATWLGCRPTRIGGTP
ncbi:DUF2231 domain-containing protein [Luteimonas viscosa]|uniref:DUF2231 domain-containing protein n=1 Tax=Luteimonas viscosa TaxID=1132694 RepID=A0A5D4XLW4_9GAMM|nr:DUF2231 domain-containing protein [Luteimonas viscosa]TYT25636.1 DUF2231 domain-containing protein [Luteimonas viscosa]